MKYRQRLFRLSFAAPACIAAAIAASVGAQENTEAAETSGVAEQNTARAFLAEELATQIEETVVLGRLQSAAGDIVLERMMSESATDIIGAEQISRIGDSNVATALRRVPGVTLVDDKFIYVRGLGERYSSTQLNGASVPSPDLTRNVLPLDIIPTSIVESLAVQKTYSTDMPIAFGGGNVDIRTKAVPDEFMFFVEVGGKYNNETSGTGLNAKSGDDDWLGTDDGTRALPQAISAALDTYAGSLSPFDIRDQLISQSGGVLSPATAFENAVEINRNLAFAMDRDLEISEGSTGQNYSAEVGIGNNWLYNNGLEFGALAGLSYSNEYATADVLNRFWNLPEEIVSFEKETTRNVSITGNIGLGLRPNDDNEIRTLSLFIRNTDEGISTENAFNANGPLSEGNGIETHEFRFEERELVINQIAGSHIWSADTRDLIGLESDLFESLDDLELEWYYSDSDATTDIPGETSLQYQTVSDPLTGEVESRTLDLNETTVDYRYTALDDSVESYGYDLTMPVFRDNFTVDFSIGWDYVRKVRSYRQIDLGLGSTDSDVSASPGQSVSDILSDENILDPDLGYVASVNNANQRSYFAAITNASGYGKVDLNWKEAWRFIVGARREDYKQFGIPWEPLNYQEQISTDPVELEEAVFTQDDYYPSVAVIFMSPDFFAETYQLRFNYAETVVRPDLREITGTSYQDPLNQGLIVEGNPDVLPSTVANTDLRSEWFFSNGDNLTVSLFFKDIENPIEYFTDSTSDAGLSAQIQNAASAEVYGIEFEWLKDLSTFGDEFSPFYLSGNVTLAESELDAGDQEDPPTNQIRPLAGASDYALNLQLGFDSDDGKHAATLVYNVFGERLRSAGTNLDPDAFEQPFHSVDLTYSYYPTYSTIVKLKLKNLLGESETWEQGGATVFEKEIGTSASVDFQWQF